VQIRTDFTPVIFSSWFNGPLLNLAREAHLFGRLMSNMKEQELEKRERRPTSRKRVLLSGLIVYGHGAFTCDCKYRNLSVAGARITLAYTLQLPSRVHLINVKDGIAHNAHIVWKKGLDFGVRFDATISLSAKPDVVIDRLKKLWLAKGGRIGVS
jgi:hypothetical protein